MRALPADCLRRRRLLHRSKFSPSTARPICCSFSSSAAPDGCMGASSARSSSNSCRTFFSRLGPSTGRSGSASYWWSSCWSVASASAHGASLCAVGSARWRNRSRAAVRNRSTEADMPVVLQTIGLMKRFSGIVPTNNVSLQLEKGSRHALIGPNGAGKTAWINLLTGVLRPSGGSILLDGEEIVQKTVHERVQLGLVRTFQINQLFGDLTPLETIGLAVSERRGQGFDWCGM